MRHGHGFRKLSRDSVKRARMMRALATGLFTHERIQTTLPRAKELRRFTDRLITHAKRDTEHGRNKVITSLNTTIASDKVLGELRERYSTRTGGYTRVWRAGPREKDKIPLGIVELVDNPWDMRKTFTKFKQEAKLTTLSLPTPFKPSLRPLLK